jgi:hypothetical protein
MAPVLVIAGMGGKDCQCDSPLTPLERFLSLVTGSNRILILH